VEYNALGLKAAIVDPDGMRTEYTYDSLKFLSQVVEAVKTPAERTTKYDNDLVATSRHPRFRWEFLTTQRRSV